MATASLDWSQCPAVEGRPGIPPPRETIDNIVRAIRLMIQPPEQRRRRSATNLSFYDPTTGTGGSARATACFSAGLSQGQNDRGSSPCSKQPRSP